MIGGREVYYNQNSALVRVEELLIKGKNVYVRRDIHTGVPIWVVEFN